MRWAHMEGLDKIPNPSTVKYMKAGPLEKLKKYEDQWVALRESTNEVVGSGENASEAKRKAEAKGHSNVILLKVLPFRGGYVPYA